MEISEEFEEYRDLWQQGQISSRHAAEMLQVSQSTFMRWAENKIGL